MLFANSIEFFTLQPVGLSKFECFIGNIPACLSYGFSILKNELSLFTFEFQEWFNGSKNIFKVISKYMPSITNLMVCYSLARIELTFEIVFKPVNQYKARVNDAKSASIVIFQSVFTGRKMLYTNAAFAIQNACQVIKSLIRPHMVPLELFIVLLYHKYSFCHSERLNPEAPKGEAIV